MRLKTKFIVALSFFTMLLTANVSAQYLTTSYFMKDNWQSNMLNPAFSPSRGYILLPVIGGTSGDVGSNSLSVDKLLYPNPNGEGLVSFLDVGIDKSLLMNSLLDNNSLNADVSTTLLGVGFHSKKIFWSFGSNLRVVSDVTLPRGVFELAKLSREDDIYNIKDLTLGASAYLENYLGASFKIGEVSVGAKIKVLLGVANASMYYDDLQVALTDSEWAISSKGRFDATLAGLSLDGSLSDFEFGNIQYDPTIKMSGFGVGVDLGVSYDILDDLTVSASATDLGYIQWSGSETISAQASGNYTYEGANFSDDDSSLGSFDIDEILQFDSVESEDRRNRLNSTFNVAGEYRLFDDILAAGLLYSARVRSNYTLHEVTAVASVRPINWFTANLSYSAIEGKMGAAINIHPSWINLFVGMDYLATKVTPQYIPISSKRLNLYFGVGIPLSKRRVVEKIVEVE